MTFTRTSATTNTTLLTSNPQTTSNGSTTYTVRSVAGSNGTDTYTPTITDFALLSSWLARAYPAGQVIGSQTTVDATAAAPVAVAEEIVTRPTSVPKTGVEYWGGRPGVPMPSP